jgi:hypothetical protein
MDEKKTRRVQVRTFDITEATQRVVDELYQRLRVKGDGAFASSHEAHGAIAEEFHEAEEALRKGAAEYDEEVTDLAVACLFALASRKSGGMEW